MTGGVVRLEVLHQPDGSGVPAEDQPGDRQRAHGVKRDQRHQRRLPVSPAPLESEFVKNAHFIESIQRFVSFPAFRFRWVTSDPDSKLRS